MNQNAGFTLIELLVVVLIIGILAAVALPQYNKAVAKSRYVQLMTIGDSIQRAEEVYYMANASYTSDLTLLDITIPESDDFAVWMDVRSNGVAALTVISADRHMGHVVYFQHHKHPDGPDWSGFSRECRVYDVDADSYLHQVCKNITGNSAGRNGVGYTIYEFK